MDWRCFVYVENLVDHDQPLEMEKFFGSEAEKMFKACRTVMRDRLFLYEGCTDEASREAWRAARSKHLAKVYGIAKSHGVFVEWLGNDSVCRRPDQFLIRKKNKNVAVIRIQ